MAGTQQPPARAIERIEAPRRPQGALGRTHGKQARGQRRLRASAGTPGRRVDAHDLLRGNGLQGPGGVCPVLRDGVDLVNADEGSRRKRPLRPCDIVEEHSGGVRVIRGQRLHVVAPGLLGDGIDFVDVRQVPIRVLEVRGRPGRSRRRLGDNE